MKKFLMVIALLIPSLAFGQKVGIKTNLLYDATSTINLGVEVALTQRLTLDISGNYNGWTFADNKKIQHWMVQPELRFWPCSSFNGHFVALHGLGGEFDLEKTKIPFLIDPELTCAHRNVGYYYGAGIGYGYHFILGKRWSLEAEVGAGWIHTEYDRYTRDLPAINVGPELEGHLSENYFGITKVALTLIFMIR